MLVSLVCILIAVHYSNGTEGNMREKAKERTAKANDGKTRRVEKFLSLRDSLGALSMLKET